MDQSTALSCRAGTAATPSHPTFPRAPRILAETPQVPQVLAAMPLCLFVPVIRLPRREKGLWGLAERGEAPGAV